MSITLAQLEQEVARRCGPYRRYFTDPQVPNTATFDFVYFPTMKSNVDLDGPTNLWMLRRGIDNQGNPVDVDEIDRQRLVSDWEPINGQVRSDRPWGGIPVPGEFVEFHHLDPEQELRVAVMAGLQRCWLPTTVQVLPTGLYTSIDLTAQLPWLTETWQVAGAQYGWLEPGASAPYGTRLQGGHVFLSGSFGVAIPTSLWVDTWQPAWSLVNGVDSETGPSADTDVLDVDLNYAASAGHIEAWHLFPARLAAAAAGGLQATQAMAAAEFTRQALIRGPQRNRDVGFSTIFQLIQHTTWVNGPV